MQRFVLARVAEAAVTLLAMSIIIFLLVRLTGDPLHSMLSEYAQPEDYARLSAELGMDKPLYVQYGVFLFKAVQGDFGESLRNKQPAFPLAIEGLKASFELAGTATAFSVLLGITLGVLVAPRKDTFLDGAAKVFALLGQSVPVFWLGLVLMLVLSVQLHLLPTSGRGGFANIILPSVAMGWYALASTLRLTRSAMLDVLNTEYVKLARIKGLPEWLVLYKHAVRNALIPVITFAATIFGLQLSGAIVVETVFGWPGVGRLAYDSLMYRDFPVMQAIVLSVTAVFVGINIVVDILYAYIDPRIRFSK